MTVVTPGKTDREITACRRCRVYGFRLRRRMRGNDPIIWRVHNGRRIIPVLCCPGHEDALIARGGWDGTGERQNKEA